MNPESFKGKVLLSLIDKAFIGIVVFTITMFINVEFDNAQKIHEESIAVAKIHSDILADQRERLIESMNSFFEKAPKIDRNTKNLDEKLRELRVLSEKISVVFFSISFTNKNALDEIADKLSDYMFSFTKEIRTIAKDKNLGEEEFFQKRKEALGKIKTTYADILDSLNELSIRTMKRELRDI
jgi:hypothetical protein